MIKVSVIVPVYNAGTKLNKCIRSIIGQTFNDIEIIFVNDGSTDNSLNIINKYKLEDKRIKIINKKNEGSIKARKKGLEMANGRYIIFVDADDWISKDFVEVLYKEISKNYCDVVVCNSYKVLGNNAIIKKQNNSHYFSSNKVYQGNEIKDQLAKAWLHGHPFPASLFAKIYRKEVLINSGKYLDRIYFLGDDLFYNMEIFNKVSRVKVINKSLYYYRAGGFTSKYMPYHFQDIVNGYEIQKDFIEKYYGDSKEKEYSGISIMLLNSFKMTLQNIINSKFTEKEIKVLIEGYVKNRNIVEAISNKGSIRYFNEDFLKAIKKSDINYLFEMAKELNKKSKKKRMILNIAIKLNVF